jgi:hypothetical protein
LIYEGRPITEVAAHWATPIPASQPVMADPAAHSAAPPGLPLQFSPFGHHPSVAKEPTHEEVMSLHRYFIAANQQRMEFDRVISEHQDKHGEPITYGSRA